MDQRDPGHDRPAKAGLIRWGEGLVAAFLLAGLLFLLYFIVPKLDVYWKQSGVSPPIWGKTLLSMMSHFEFVVFGGLILVVLSFRRRA